MHNIFKLEKEKNNNKNILPNIKIGLFILVTNMEICIELLFCML